MGDDRRRAPAWWRRTCWAGICLVTASLYATAQDADKDARLLNGEPLLPRAYVHLVRPTTNERATLTRVAIDGMHFDEAMRIVNHRPMKRAYDFQTVVNIPGSVSTGQVLHVQFYARGRAPSSPSGEAKAMVYFQQTAPDYKKDLSKTFTVGPAWTRFDYAFTTTRAYAGRPVLRHRLWCPGA